MRTYRVRIKFRFVCLLLISLFIIVSAVGVRAAKISGKNNLRITVTENTESVFGEYHYDFKLLIKDKENSLPIQIEDIYGGIIGEIEFVGDTAEYELQISKDITEIFTRISDDAEIEITQISCPLSKYELELSADGDEFEKLSADNSYYSAIQMSGEDHELIFRYSITGAPTGLIVIAVLAVVALAAVIIVVIQRKHKA